MTKPLAASWCLTLYTTFSNSSSESSDKHLIWVFYRISLSFKVSRDSSCPVAHFIISWLVCNVESNFVFQFCNFLHFWANIDKGTSSSPQLYISILVSVVKSSFQDFFYVPNICFRHHNFLSSVHKFCGCPGTLFNKRIALAGKFRSFILHLTADINSI